jgi:hypothetical protein
LLRSSIGKIGVPGKEEENRSILLIYEISNQGSGNDALSKPGDAVDLKCGAALGMPLGILL